MQSPSATNFSARPAHGAKPFGSTLFKGIGCHSSMAAYNNTFLKSKMNSSGHAEKFVAVLNVWQLYRKCQQFPELKQGLSVEGRALQVFCCMK
jgi:hypothetical protein